MAEAEFDTKAIERILRAILPDGIEDPFGELRRMGIQAAEDQNDFETAWEIQQKVLGERLDTIETRTFGILILQIVKIIRTLFGLLPAGRFILIAIAAFGLIATFIDKGEVTGVDIRGAIEKSGLGAFIRDQLKRLQVLAEEQAQRVEDVIDLGSDVVRTSAAKADAVIADVEFLFRKATDLDLDPEEFRLIAANVLTETVSQANDLGNLMANQDSLIFGALRGIPSKIRSLPNLASELVE